MWHSQGSAGNSFVLQQAGRISGRMPALRQFMKRCIDMNMTFLIILLFSLPPAMEHMEEDWDDMLATVETMYPLWKLNGVMVNEAGLFRMILADPDSTTLEIPGAETLLNGVTWTLLGITGNVTGDGRTEYVIGTCLEAPTYGHLFVYTGPSDEPAVIRCHKIVMLELTDITGDGLSEILSVEDNHYGTNTTRRVFNVYHLSSPSVIHRVFSHDVLDLTDQREAREYTVDYRGRLDEGIILVTPVTSPTASMEYRWDGERYILLDLQQQASALFEQLRSWIRSVSWIDGEGDGKLHSEQWTGMSIPGGGGKVCRLSSRYPTAVPTTPRSMKDTFLMPMYSQAMRPGSGAVRGNRI